MYQFQKCNTFPNEIEHWNFGKIEKLFRLQYPLSWMHYQNIDSALEEHQHLLDLKQVEKMLLLVLNDEFFFLEISRIILNYIVHLHLLDQLPVGNILKPELCLFQLLHHFQNNILN